MDVHRGHLCSAELVMLELFRLSACFLLTLWMPDVYNLHGYKYMFTCHSDDTTVQV